MEKVPHTGNTAALFDTATDWIVRIGVLRPQRETTIERLIYRAHTQAEEALFEQILTQLSTEDQAKLDALLDISQGESQLSWLTGSPACGLGAGDQRGMRPAGPGSPIVTRSPHLGKHDH